MVVYGNMDVTGVLVCGGDSSRFGQDKRILVINGKTLIESGLEKLSAMCKEVMLAPRTKNNLPKFLLPGSFKIIEDAPKVKGPMAAISAALLHAKYENILILGCDFPFVSIRFLQYLIDIAISNPAKIVVCKLHDVLQPLVAVYKKNIANTLSLWQQDKKNYSIKNFLVYNRDLIYVVDKCDIVDFERELFNLNTPSDYEKLKLMLEMEK